MTWSIHSLSDLDRLASTWNALNDAMGSMPFLHSRFMRPMCDVFGGPELKLALCSGSDGPLAMGILQRRNMLQWETFQPSQLPLGAWVMRPDQNFEALLASLASRLPGLTVSIGVTQQDPNCIKRPPDSARLKTLDYIQTARIEVTGRFDAYWNARGKNLRQNMRKQRVKLERDGIATRLEVLTRPEDVAGALEDYGRLESSGWKAEGGTAIHPSNAQGRFYRSMLEAFAAVDAARIYRYWFNESVVAVDLCILGGGALVILKTTYDESTKAVSPAFLMREEAFRVLFEERTVAAIEFFGKVMDWHTRWANDTRTLYHVNYYRSGLVPRVRSGLARLQKPSPHAPAPTQ